MTLDVAPANSTLTAAVVALIDDNEVNRSAVARMLSAAGFTVREGASIADGARLVLEAPDMLVLGVGLPGGNGFEFCRRLRADPATRDLPLLLISANFIGSEWEAEAPAGGADGYLTFPVEPLELAATVRALLRVRDAERRVRRAAREAAREWAATFDALREPICVTNADGVILRCNDAFAELVGRPFPAIVGRPLGVFLPDVADRSASEVTIGSRSFRIDVHVARGSRPDAPIVRVLTDITERKRAARRQHVELAVAQVFAGGTPHERVMHEILRAIGEGLEWRWGSVWTVDADRETVRCTETWSSDAVPPAAFAAATRGGTFSKGEGLPGRVWAAGELAWITDVVHQLTPDRRVAARAAGLHGALAIPVRVGGEVVAVLEFFSGHIEEPDQELLAVLATIGSHIGQFVERTRAHLRIGRLLAEEQRARATAEAAAARDAFLADAGNLLASSLDYEATLQQVAAAAAERFVDWCAIDVVEDDGRVRRLAMVHADPERVRRVWEVYERSPGALGGVAVLKEIGRSRRPMVVRHVTEKMLRRLAADEGHFEILRALGVTSYLTVPVLLRDRVLGAVTFALGNPGRRFIQADLIVAMRLAPKVALAIDNARLFQDVRAAVQRKDETLAFLDTVLRTAPVGLAFLDRELAVVRINNALAEMIGRPAEEQLGRHIDEVLPAAWGRLAGCFRQVFETGQPLTDFEWSGDHPGRPGRVQHVVASYYPICGPDGVNWVGVVVGDVTERRRAEEAVRQAQKLESIGLLAGGIAHDFNNLLTGILGNASLARHALPPASPAAPMLADVVRAGERAAALTSQLLAYAGKGRFYVQPLNLAKLVRDITGLIHTSLPKKAELRVHLDSTLPLVEADAGQLQQVVMNLVINGAEAIGDMAGTVSVNAEAVEMTEVELQDRFPTFYLAPGRYVRLEVCDTGSGMDAATQARIFDPFFTTKFTGRGLGLAAVLGIIRGHKGGISVRSAPGRGTTFTVVLPALVAPAPAESVPNGAVRHPGSGTVLVVDDEDVVRRIARKALEDCGYTVVEAVNGLEAVDLVRRHGKAVVLVLLDMTMPIMGGDEAVRHLKRLRPDLPVLAMSGYGELEAIRRFTGTGIDGFLQKPYTAEQLLEYLAAALMGR